MPSIKSNYADLLFFVSEIKQKSPSNILIGQTWRWKRQKMYFTTATSHRNARFLLRFRSARGFLTKPPAKLSFLLVRRLVLSALTSHSRLPQVSTDAEISQFCWRKPLLSIRWLCGLGSHKLYFSWGPKNKAAWDGGKGSVGVKMDEKGAGE